jgi:hypothetical protein
MIDRTTVFSVLAALLLWDGVMYAALGTSPVAGALANEI